MIVRYSGKNPNVHETVFAAEGAHIIGDVAVGEYSSIWFNAVGDVVSGWVSEWVTWWIVVVGDGEWWLVGGWWASSS